MKPIHWTLTCLILSTGCFTDAGGYTPDPTKYMSLVVAAAPKPSDMDDKPVQPSGVCENCAGRGWVGDSITKKVCPVCKGTGKAAVSMAPAVTEPTPSQIAPVTPDPAITPSEPTDSTAFGPRDLPTIETSADTQPTTEETTPDLATEASLDPQEESHEDGEPQTASTLEPTQPPETTAVETKIVYGDCLDGEWLPGTIGRDPSGNKVVLGATGWEQF